MDYNNNYDFKYPGGDDFYNVEDFNGNFDKVADELDDVNTALRGKASVKHSHDVGDLSGILPVYRGGTGQNSVDIKPISGSEKMVTSGGVYSALEGKQNKYSYVIANYDSDNNLKQYADFILNENGSNFNDLQTFISNIPRNSIVKMLLGNYVFTDTLVLNKAVIIEGSGHGTTIQIGENSKIGIYINNTDSQISNVTISNLNLSCYEGPTGQDYKTILYMSNINGVYIYNVRFGYSISTTGCSASLIKGANYLRNIHIHDCVMNSSIESPLDDSYTIDFINVTSLTELCAFISGCSCNSSGKFCIRVPNSSYASKLALYGFIGEYSIYGEDNQLIKTVGNSTYSQQEVVLSDSTDI